MDGTSRLVEKRRLSAERNTAWSGGLLSIQWIQRSPDAIVVEAGRVDRGQARGVDFDDLAAKRRVCRLVRDRGLHHDDPRVPGVDAEACELTQTKWRRA